MLGDHQYADEVQFVLAFLESDLPGTPVGIAAALGRLSCVRVGAVLRYSPIPLVNVQVGAVLFGRIAVGHDTLICTRPIAKNIGGEKFSVNARSSGVYPTADPDLGVGRVLSSGPFHPSMIASSRKPVARRRGRHQWIPLPPP